MAKPKRDKGSAARRAARTVNAGSRRFSIAAGKTATVRVRLTRRGRAIMRRARNGRVRAQVVIRARLGTAAPRTVRKTVVLSAQGTRHR